jgi:hypothetical protein
MKRAGTVGIDSPCFDEVEYTHRGIGIIKPGKTGTKEEGST